MSNVNQTYREVQRKANAGERIMIVNTVDCRYEIGEVFVVETSSSGGVYVKHPEGTNNGRMGIGHGAYVVLEPIANPTPVSGNLPDLFTQFIRDNAGAVRSYLAEIDPVDSAEPVTEIDEPAPPPLTRAKVIEMARERVAELERAGRSGAHGNVPPGTPLNGKLFTLKFRVNRERRTVVAEVIGTISGKRLTKAYAKAAPDDVFNADIGMAIAAERALGLALTDAFVNAPKPDGPRIGSVVKKTCLSYAGESGPVTDTSYPGVIFASFSGESGRGDGTIYADVDYVTILDDTDAVYTESAAKDGEAA